MNGRVEWQTIWFTFSNEEKYANIVTTLCLSKCEKESEEMKAEVDGKPMSVNGITDELKETTLQNERRTDMRLAQP